MGGQHASQSVGDSGVITSAVKPVSNYLTIRVSSVHARGRGHHPTDEEAARERGDAGAASRQSRGLSAARAHRTCQKQGQTLPHTPRDHPDVERRDARHGDGARLCTASFSHPFSTVMDTDGLHRDELYWITSSARKRSTGGMVRPSAWAVLRLMTSSKLGCLNRPISLDRFLDLSDLLEIQ